MRTHPTHHSRYRATPLLAALLLIASISSSIAEDAPSLDVPFVPTPMSVVERMLQLADPKPGEYLIDLGSGDGRIPVAAAKTYGVTALGIDLDPSKVADGEQNARDAGVADRVTFREEDLFDTDLSKADVLTMYLLPRINEQLKPRILNEMKPGARVVSHAFTMPEWEPVHDELVEGRRVYMWIVPTKAEGRWTIGNGERKIEISIGEQSGDKINVEAEASGKPLLVKDTKLRGERLSFVLEMEGEEHRFEGRVDNGRLIDLTSDRGDNWVANPA